MRLASASRGLLIHLFGLYKKRLNRGQGHCVFKSIQVQKQLFVMVAHLDALQVAPPSASESSTWALLQQRSLRRALRYPQKRIWVPLRLPTPVVGSRETKRGSVVGTLFIHASSRSVQVVRAK